MPAESSMANPAVAGPSIGKRLRGMLPMLGSLQSYIGLILVVLAGIITKGSIFLTTTNLSNAVGAFSSRGILAVGETIVILTGGIDLSVGSLLGVSSMASALMLTHFGWSPLPILLGAMIVGGVFGFANGAATAWLRIQSFVATLAMLSVARGLAREVSGNVSVGTQIVGADGRLSAPSAAFQLFGTPGHNILAGVPLPLLGTGGFYYPVVAFVIVCFVFQWILSMTAFGRHVYAVGGNETAARLSGVNVTLTKVAVFTISGILAGFAGTIDAAYSASADPLAGQSYELDAIAAAVIGGTSLSGGRGTIIGTLVGALILTLLDNVLGINGVSDNDQLIVKGLIVVLAVVLQRPDFFRSVFAFFSKSKHSS
jgi:ribose transport system permease protein